MIGSFRKSVFSAAVLLTMSASVVLAQKQEALPFAAGETLVYEAKLSKIVSGLPIADLTFVVANGTPGELQIKADARSKGTLLKLAHYSFLYSFASSIDTSNFRINSTERKTTEKERVRTGEAKFDYGEKRVTYLETDPAEPMKPPRKIASGIEDKTQDVVSGIYSLRLLPLGIGKRFDITVSDSGLVYDVPVRVASREKQKSILGDVWCYRLEPEVFGPGHMVEDKGSMSIWITDDARRIPVRSRIDTSFGRVEVRLRSISTPSLTASTTTTAKIR
jgi:hypothetical protein